MSVVVEAGAPPVSLAEVKAYLRLDTDAEDALLAGLVRTASGLCEAFTGQVLMSSVRAAEVPADGAWHRLMPTPVKRLVTARGLDASGAELPLLPDALDLQVDFCGDGWVRVLPDAGAVRAVLSVEAGLATDWNALPEALRQGIVRLVAHLYANRDRQEEGGPPAAISALWRPWRRMRLS
ncbi:MAG: head-tail connector protein [Pacificimonas sp.]